MVHENAYSRACSQRRSANAHNGLARTLELCVRKPLDIRRRRRLSHMSRRRRCSPSMTFALVMHSQPRVLASNTPAFIPTSPSPCLRRTSRDVCARPIRSTLSLTPRRSPLLMTQAARSPSETAPGGTENAAPEGSVRLNLFGYSGTFNARLILLGVPLLWGSFPPVAKLLYQLPWAFSPALFNALRLSVSTACVFPALLRDLRSKKPDSRKLILGGAELGLWTFLANTIQILGLQYTTASRGAFLTQLQTVLVPLFAAAVGLASSLSWHVWAASSLALGGVGLLTLDNAGAAFSLRGDGTMIVVAVLGAIYVLRTRAVARKLRSAPLVAYKVVFQMMYAFVFMGLQAMFCGPGGAGRFPGGLTAMFGSATPMLIAVNFALVVWAGAFVSAMATWLHVRANTVVPAAETAVIFSFTPLWASAFAVYLGERFGTKGIIGGALIVLSTVLASRAPREVAAAAPKDPSQRLPPTSTL